jgi:hypothetical protein
MIAPIAAQWQALAAERLRTGAKKPSRKRASAKT